MRAEGDTGAPDRQYLRTIFDTIPLPTLIVGEDMCIQDFNRAAAALLGPAPEKAIHRRGGDVLHCIHAVEGGCGKGAQCPDCVLRSSLQQALEGRETYRRIHKAELRQAGQTKPIDLLVTVTPMPGDDAPKAVLVLEDVTELTALRNLIPICTNCKKLRDDDQFWHSVDSYLSTRMHLRLTHGLCPVCFEEKVKEIEALRVPDAGKRLVPAPR